MARKHEHFGLRYLEELNILKERENICKESRREFLKFKQETTTAPTDLSKPLLEVTAPEESMQSILSQSSGLEAPLLFTESAQFPFELDTAKIKKKVRISPDIIDTQKQTEDIKTQQKISSKKEPNIDKKQSHASRKANLECKSDTLEYEGEKAPVVIASLAGTSKQLTISKKPESPQKAKYQKVVRRKSQFKSPVFLQQDSTLIEQTDKKILSEHARHIIAVPSTFTTEMDDSHSVISSLSEKSKITKEHSKRSPQGSLADFEKPQSKKDSASSSAKSVPESMEEILSRSRSGISKVHVKYFSRSKSQMQASAHKLSSGPSQRSIDEIIASLTSTAPTASDLRIKELVESILGQDYNIKIELPAVKKETQSSELAMEVTSAGPEQVTPSSSVGTELWMTEVESPVEAVTEQVTPADTEQTKLETTASPQKESVFYEVEQKAPTVEDTAKVEDIPESSKRGSIFFKEEEEASKDIPGSSQRGNVSFKTQQEASQMPEETAKVEDTSRSSQRGGIYYKIQQEAPKEEYTAKLETQEELTEKAEEKPVCGLRIPSQEVQSIRESESGSSLEIEQIQESVSSMAKDWKKCKTEGSEESLFPGMGLTIKGKAFSKVKPVEIQKSLADVSEPQPLSLLSTWTTKIKDVDYPLIHLLCTGYPRCILPINLQLVSRVHHTLDKKGHHVLLPSVNLTSHKSEDFFPATAALEEQMEGERICHEGLPISEVYQSSQEDGIKVLPPRSPRSMPEWQRVAEYYVEKPQLELLGKQVKLHPASLKMFWTPAPQKFAASLSLMKETLFSKYESNLISGVIYENFSCDLRDKEESDSDDDFDNILSNLTLRRRCSSCPQLFFSGSESEVDSIRRTKSAPELSSYRDKTSLKISTNFRTTMEEISIMKKHISLADAEAVIPETKISSAKLQEIKTVPNQIILPSSQGISTTEKDSDSVLTSTMKLAAGSLFSSATEPAEHVPPLDDIALAEKARKAGITYIVFPKKTSRRKSLKSGRCITPQVLETVYDKLNEPPRILKRSVSLGKLPTHNKFIIQVSRAVQHYRSPSLPCWLDFAKFLEEQGRKPEDTDDYLFVRMIWNKWFDELYPPSRPSTEDKSVSSKKEREEETKEKEITDSVNPLLIEGRTEELEQCLSEINRISQINEECLSAFNYCRRGALYRKIGKMKAAMDDLEKAISLEPKLVNAYWHRHLLFLYHNKILQALEDLNFIIKCNKNNADAYLSRADIYKRQGDNSLAIINYTLAMRCRPTDDEIYYKRGEAYEQEGDLLLAMEDYSKCLCYNPKRIDALMKHGIYYFNKSAWNVAINDFTTVIEEDPNNAEARTYRGRAHLKQKQYKNSAEDFSAAIHLNPRNWLAYYYRGCILRKIDPKQALQDFSISVLLDDSYDNLGAFLHRGVLYAEQKQWMLAIYDFKSALELDRTLTEAYVNIGLIFMLHLDHYFESIRQFTHAIQVDPLDIRPYLCRAQAYNKIHDLKSAVKDINRAIHLQPNSAHLCLKRGQYLLAMKNYELASFCIYQVAKVDQGSLECSLVQEALVQSFCQNHNKAIECALSVTKQEPEPAMFVLLGKIQMKARKHKDAIASFKQALKLLTGTAKNPPNTFEAAEMYFLIGQCYMEQISLFEACDAFTAAVRLYPHYADAFYQRGLCRMQLQQAKCILDFNKTLSVSPKHFQAYLSRAAYYGSKGRFSKAIMNCTEAIKIEPRSVRAYLYRGVLKFYNRTYKEAAEDLTNATLLDNTCILAYYNRAISFHQLKEYKKDFLETAQSKPKDTKLLQVIGLCCHRLQKYEEAVQSFSKVLKLDPFSLDGYIGRGNSYLEYGHVEGTEQALKDFLKALHLNPISIKARVCLGYNLQALGKFQKAWAQFTAAILLDPKCHIAYDGRAIVCLQMGDTFAAFQDTNAALKIITNAELLTNRGVINQFMGYLNCAMKDYQQAITIDPKYALAYYNAANIYFVNKQFSQANNYYTKALTLDPQNESAFLNRAITNTLLKNFEEAKEDFEKAVCLSPFSAAIYFNKANLYNMLQQYEQAEEDISKALSIQPYDSLMYKLRADIRGKMGFIREAIADYKKAVSIQELISTG
uniref:Tetratricopeptide repeat protein 6 isoform X2 n=1 Tax=Pogona vitticeps TaxID=103695 RepID=A0ABM5FAT0_9SAUR